MGNSGLKVDWRREEGRESRVVRREDGSNSEVWKMGGELKGVERHHTTPLALSR